MWLATKIVVSLLLKLGQHPHVTKLWCLCTLCCLSTANQQCGLSRTMLFFAEEASLGYEASWAGLGQPLLTKAGQANLGQPRLAWRLAQGHVPTASKRPKLEQHFVRFLP